MSAPSSLDQLSAAFGLQSPTAGPSAGARAWRVIHAAETARDVLPVIEGQLAAGMRPYIVTPYGSGRAEAYLAGPQDEGRRPASLLRAWSDVRNWRKSLVECDPASRSEIVHAHSFPAGMAAVRTCPVVVYDVAGFVEESGAGGTHAEQGTWMARSFRVAEHFVITRAAALVVHSSAMREGLLARGGRQEDVFLIPEVIDAEAHELQPDHAWLNARSPHAEGTVILAAASSSLEECELLLRAFAQVVGEEPQVRLLLATTADMHTTLRTTLATLEIASTVVLAETSDAATALSLADVVICGPTQPADIRGGLAAMANRHALLAADCAANRDLTPDGRGCLWFRPGDWKDLAYRAAFLARNADFRRVLGQAGRQHLEEFFTPAAVGQKYDAVYRHALNNRQSGAGAPPVPSLEPIQACW